LRRERRARTKEARNDGTPLHSNPLPVAERILNLSGYNYNGIRVVQCGGKPVIWNNLMVNIV